MFRYLPSVVVECPDLLLMFSLFVADKEFVDCVLDIASLFARKLVIDDLTPFSDSIASGFVGKLVIDG